MKFKKYWDECNIVIVFSEFLDSMMKLKA